MQKLNGWMRLWVVLSTIWFAVVVYVYFETLEQVFVGPDELENVDAALYDLKGQDGVWDIHHEDFPFVQLSLRTNATTARDIKITLRLDSKAAGIKKTITGIPLNVSDEEFRQKFRKDWSDLMSIPYSPQAESELLQALALAKDQALAAEELYLSRLEALQSAKQRMRFEEVKQFLITLFAPLIVLLPLGIGVAWVRRGFAESN